MHEKDRQRLADQIRATPLEYLPAADRMLLISLLGCGATALLMAQVKLSAQLKMATAALKEIADHDCHCDGGSLTGGCCQRNEEGSTCACDFALARVALKDMGADGE